MLASLRRAGCLFAVSTVLAVACGGKTVTGLDEGGVDAQPPAPPASSEAGPPEPFDAGGRTCTSTCAQPHQCCENGCGGLPAAMPTACCTCLPSETPSEQCTNNKCGG